MRYQLAEKVHVDMRVDGQAIDGDFGPGDSVELPEAVAALLIAQGHAAPAKAAPKQGKAATPATSDVETETTE